MDGDLVNLGESGFGNTLLINREVYEADLLITTGVIAFHYFAGFSGGRKSILPGVAGRATIERNHRAMPGVVEEEPSLKTNPINLEMIEAARKVGVDFILNVVTNSKKEVVKIVAGDLVEAWLTGTKVCSKMYRKFFLRKADIVIASCGGHPRDINIYQAQKGLENAGRVTKDGGIIILLAECSKGLGDKVFAAWMEKAKNPQDNLERIKKEFVIGGHKAFALCKVGANKEVILLSELDHKTTEMLFMKKMERMEEALSYAYSRIGREAPIIVLPEAGLVHPYLQENQ